MLPNRLIPGKQLQPLMFRCGVALYLAVILLGAVPGAREEIGAYASGLVLHFATYACIAFLLACGAAGNATTKAIKAVCMVAAMGALDETMQGFLPYREGAVTDWLIDVGAALLTALLFRMVHAGKASSAS